jgi:hypothetical protein
MIDERVVPKAEFPGDGVHQRGQFGARTNLRQDAEYRIGRRDAGWHPKLPTVGSLCHPPSTREILPAAIALFALF